MNVKWYSYPLLENDIYTTLYLTFQSSQFDVITQVLVLPIPDINSKELVYSVNNIYVM